MKSILLSLLLFALSAVAHDGPHDAPGAVASKRGGVVRALETIILEMVSEGDNLKIYVFEAKDPHPEMKAASFPASALILVKGKKPEELKLSVKENHWEGTYQAPKGLHRYTLEFHVTQGGHDDKVKWTVEPKRKMK